MNEGERPGLLELTQVFEGSPHPLCILAMDGSLRFANRALAEMAGRAHPIPQGTPCSELLPGTLCDGADCPRVLLLRGRPRVECEVDIRRPDGSVMACNVTAWPVRDEAGGVVAIIKHLHDITPWKRARDEAQRHARERMEQQADLARKVAALRELINSVEREKEEVRQGVLKNVETILMPMLQGLERELPPERHRLVQMLRDGLEEITSPMAGRLSREFASLTPAELRICHLIRRGLSAKEIGKVEHISPATVHTHRHHIRRKLGLANQEVNLAAFLKNFFTESGPETARK